jgi:hypothetical protein
MFFAMIYLSLIKTKIMSETNAVNNPNIAVILEQERQANLLLTEIMDNPKSIGASVEKGNYSRVETENEVHEKIDVESEHSDVKLRASRSLEHDPKRHLPGKHSETITIYTNIPSIAQLSLVMVNGKVWSIEYGDQFGSKNMDGLEEALEAIRFAIKELS